MDQHPPKWAKRLLLAFLRDEFVEDVTGDLDEKFYDLLKSDSLSKARRNYWFEVLNYMRPFAFQDIRLPLIFPTMFKHHFRIGLRVLLKNKVFSALNIGGLALGMTVAILIGLWIHDEFTFNQHHEKYDRIVQVLRMDTDEGLIEVNSSLVGMVGEQLRENYSHYFERVAMTFFRSGEQMLQVGDKSFEEMGFFFQPSIGDILALDMIAGSRKGLEDPKSILISASLAQKCFGTTDAIGEVITFNVSTSLQVAGVYRDLPRNSTFNEAAFFASQHLIYNESNPYTWDNYNMRVYAELKPDVALEDASLAIKDLMVEFQPPEADPIALFLLPMRDWHLRDYFEEGQPATSQRMEYIYLYGILGVLVLFIAFINFMNLNTARFQTRSKEVGVRKTIGSLRSQLIWQFLSESILYAAAALCISLLVVLLLLPWFNGIAAKSMAVPWTNPWFWLTCLGFMLFSALLAGSYPAIFLSSFNPVTALKGRLKQGVGSVRFRQVLVVFQFTVSIMLIIGTITVDRQVQHAKNRPVGYNQDRLIALSGRSRTYYDNHDILRNELNRTGVVVEVAAANYPLMNTLGNNGGFRLRGASSPYNITFNTIQVSPEYGRTTEWELVAGRDFSRDLIDERNSIIVSESGVKRMGLENPVGQELTTESPRYGRTRFVIIGVVKDMIKGSPFAPPLPLMAFSSEEAQRFLFIRIKPDVGYQEAISKIRTAFQTVLPAHPFKYQFVGDIYLTKFRAEEQIGSLATFFSILAILISCLGLFGLSAFVVNQRVKEIGIRKVLGASVFNLWALLSRDFGILLLVSSVLAVPISFYFTSGWLAGYTYRIELDWWIFALGCFVCIAISLLTISYHSLKISRAHPVESLRSE